MEVSIVIPVFKPNQDYLKLLFTSIANQSLTDFEIIISDDSNSNKLITDSLPSSLKDKVIYIQNLGKSGIFSNLNNALRHANGSLVQLFCQDDIMLPDLLQANRDKISDDTELVFSQFDAISSTNELMSINRDEWKFIPTVISSNDANNYFLYFGCIPGNLSPIMFRKSLLEKIGYFDESYQYIGDYDFWIRAAKFTNLYFNKEKHLLVRRHKESAASQLGSLQRFTELKQLLPYLLANNSLPFSKSILRRYIHIHVFRTVFLHHIVKAMRFDSINFSQFLIVFDGNPFSIRLAFLSFLSPIPTMCRSLKQVMEVNRV